jgi:hypothetical protein
MSVERRIRIWPGHGARRRLGSEERLPVERYGFP